MKAQTLAQILLERAGNSDQHREAIVYLRPRGPRVAQSGAQLLQRVQAVAHRLQQAGVHSGDRVLLMLPSQREFVEAFLGVVWLGAVPVPLSPPMIANQYGAFITRFIGIARNAQARLLVAGAELADAAAALADDLKGELVPELGGPLEVLTAASWEDVTDVVTQAPPRQASDLALLQYTSGSTGAPKGVALSHANIIANISAIGGATGFTRDDVGVSWLPLYHDMGLLGGLLTTLSCGAPLICMSPVDFAKDAGSWLRAISSERGTLSPAPNFAFRRCLRLSEQDTAGLDLSSWRVAFNGAEAVDTKTVQRFVERFSPQGFRASTLYPVYGLAEHTLAVSFPKLGSEPRVDRVERSALAERSVAVPVRDDHPDALGFVSVGEPLSGVELQLRRPDGTVIHDDGHVGEIFVKGPSVMTGYFNNAEASAAALPGGWLKTGDLAYRRADQLFITGRSKDLIIRAGRNHYPEDIEAAAGEVEGAVPGRVVAFSLTVEDDGEHTAVIAETLLTEARDRAALKDAIATAVALRVGLRPERVEVTERGSLPLTSSGKLRRSEARAMLMRGELPVG